MHQSATKFKVTALALVAIVFACLLLVVGVIEIKKYHDYRQQISAQEQQIKDLENAKNYYQSNNYDDNASRDNGHAQDGDLVFGEE